MGKLSVYDEIPEGIILRNGKFELDEKHFNTNVEKNSPLLIVNKPKPLLIETEGEQPLYPVTINEDKPANEQDLAELQKTMDETEQLLPTELNFRNERKYKSDDEDDNILLIPNIE